MITEKEIMTAYRKYRDKFDKIALSKTKDLDKLYKEAESAVVREEYCIGSDMLLGYYNPSPVLDLVVGNMNRGKISDKRTRLQKPTHNYGFDENGRLRIIKYILPKNYEDFDERTVLEYDGNIVNVISYRNAQKDKGISHIALFEYDDNQRIIKVTDCDIVVGRCATVRQECYTYCNDSVESMTLWDCYTVDEDGLEMIEDMCSAWYDKAKASNVLHDIKSTGCIYSVELYRFFHDESGYIVGYEVVDKNGETTMYEVPKRKRRKV